MAIIPYFNLHTHLQWSNLRMLDTINKPEVIVQKAQELGLAGFALTDHESLSGHIQMIQLQKKYNNAGIPFRIFLGDEIYLVDSIEEVRDHYQSGITKFFHFILIAKDAIGHKQLRQISSTAWNNSFYTGKMERTPVSKSEVEQIIGNDKGHLIFSTACIGSQYAHYVLNDAFEELYDAIKWAQRIALPENFYLEMQPNDCDEQVKVNQTYVKLSHELDIKTIITTDVHYPTADLAKTHEAYLNSRDDESRETLEFYKTCYLMDSDEIHQWMDKQIGAEEVDKALNNTIEIADKIEFFDLAHTQVVPKITLPNFTQDHSFSNVYEQFEYIKKFAYSDNEYDRYFLQQVENGWWEKEYSEDLSVDTQKAMLSRINDELQAIWESSKNINDNIASYYITAKYLVDMMWNDANSLVGDARGSVAAFYVCYLIGLQQINSFKYNIPYWRHLHESRPEMPDVDIDSEKSKRQAIIEATRNRFGADRVLNICSFRTEGSKQAIITSCRGLGIDNDEAQYIASLIPSIRGKLTSLHEMVYGNEEDGTRPNSEFINECNKFPRLLDTALTIEGLICGRSIHASGVIIFDQPFVELNCMMKAPNKQPTTQWDMDDSTYCGGLKYDFLTIVNLDAMHQCMNLLLKFKYIEDQGSLKKTYDKYFAPDVIDYDDEHMWEMAEKHEIINLFQFMTAVGQQAIAKVKPRSLTQLGVANAIMRLAGQPGQESPLDTYVRYKNDISQWYDCMKSYNLTEDEIKIMEDHLLSVYGAASMQEEIMKLSMDERITGYSMKEANSLRKLIAKKKIHLQAQAKEEFYKAGESKGTSDNLLNYIWEQCVTPQLSYSFSLPHILGYSTIAVQEANMAAKYPIIFWNTANLIVDSMSDEEFEGGSTDYGAIGIAIAGMQHRGITIANPDINESEFGFSPDVENNTIICGLKNLCGIGDEVTQTIIANRPYTSMEDFATRMLDTKIIKNAQMIVLIKAGCFLKLHSKDRFETMKWYLNRYQYAPIEKLTLSQLASIESYDIVPENLKILIRILHFKDYVLDDEALVETYIKEGKKPPKAGYHDRYYILDDNSQPFFKEHFSEESIVKVTGEHYVISEKKFIKEIDKLILPLRDWFNSEEAITSYNKAQYQAIWNKHANGSEASWAMQSLTYYDQRHELDDIDEELYGIVNYFELPEQPEVYDHYFKFVSGERKQFDKYKILRIAGTVLQSDSAHHTIMLLTRFGVVQVKYSKGQHSYYDKQISKMNENGKKKTIERSWFTRGTLLAVVGTRIEDTFRAMNYTDSIYKHTTERILEVHEDGTLLLQAERAKV